MRGRRLGRNILEISRLVDGDAHVTGHSGGGDSLTRHGIVALGNRRRQASVVLNGLPGARGSHGAGNTLVVGKASLLMAEVDKAVEARHSRARASPFALLASNLSSEAGLDRGGQSTVGVIGL